MSEIIHDGVIYETIGNDVIVRGLDKNCKMPDSRSITIPMFIEGNPVVMVAQRAFSGSPLKRLVLPSSVSVIGNSAFKNSALELLEFDYTEKDLYDKTLNIGEQAFYNCVGLKGLGTLRNLAVAYQAFWGCFSLDTTQYSISVVEVQEDAFMHCWKATTLCLADNAKLKRNCFRDASIQTLYANMSVKFEEGVIDNIYAAGTTIYTPANSELWDLAYEGIRVEEMLPF